MIKKKVLALGLLGALFCISGTFIHPIKAEALGSIGSVIGGIGQKSDFDRFDPDWTGVDPSLMYKILPPRMRFNGNDSEHKNYYSSYGNYMFYTVYGQSGKRITYYSPVTTTSDQTGYSSMRNNYYIKENKEKKFKIVDGLSYVPDINFTTNFKSKASPPNQQNYNVLFEGQTKNPVYPFEGKSGEWRYLGYGETGYTMSNPYFLNDVLNSYNVGTYPYDTKPWDYSIIPGGGTAYDDPDLSSYYEKKTQAITKLLNQEPLMKKKSNKVSYWANRLSLRNDPTRGTGLFMGTKGDGGFYRTISLYPPDITTINLRLVSMTVTDQNGTVYGSFTRNATTDGTLYGGNVSYSGKKLNKGGTYKLSITVKNMSGYELTVDPKEVFATIGINDIAYSSDVMFQKYTEQQKLTESGHFMPYETSKPFETTFTVPDNTDKYIRFTGLIGDKHRINMENVDPSDDWGLLQFEVQSVNNMKVTGISLVDKNNNVVNNPLPGEEYKIRYQVKYSGTDKIEPIWSTATAWASNGQGGGRYYSYNYISGWKYPKFDLPFISTIYRQLPSSFGYNETSTRTLHQLNGPSEVRNGNTYTYETEYLRYEAPQIYTTGQVDPVLASQGLDNSSADNDISKEWVDKYNIKVQNVKVLAPSERPVEPGYLYFGVQYDVVMEAPSYVKDYEKDVKMVINLGSATTSKIEHIKVGTNSKITQEFKIWVDPSKDKEIYAQVTANVANKEYPVYENDSARTDNVGKATGYILAPIDPNLGACSLGGVTIGNSWTQNYNEHNWGGTYIPYTNVAGTTSYAFNKYYSMGDNTEKVAQNESFKITKVLFRSKLTEDTQQGPNKDGWVDLTTGVVGQIKAGYGYELKVEVTYNTNAFNQPSPWVYGSHNEYGMWVRPINITPNIPKELFVKTSDGKLLSVTGENNTIQGLVVASSSGSTQSTANWVYTIKSKDTLGIKSVPKIFIDENTKDGTYGLQVFTPEINGVPTKTAGKTLCDVKNVKIQVKGSSTDDLNGHIIQ